MKKLFLLFAAITCGLTANAQINTFAKSGMVVLVAGAKSSFDKNTSYRDWEIQQTGSTKTPTIQEDKFLKEVYGFLSSNYNSDQIYKSYDGSSLLELSKLKSKGGLVVLENTTSERNWWLWMAIKIMEILFEDMMP